MPATIIFYPTEAHIAQQHLLTAQASLWKVGLEQLEDNANTHDR